MEPKSHPVLAHRLAHSGRAAKSRQKGRVSAALPHALRAWHTHGAMLHRYTFRFYELTSKIGSMLYRADLIRENPEKYERRRP